jgi:bifunctional oligoribonuclease and PAP phosphatase NrnA
MVGKGPSRRQYRVSESIQAELARVLSSKISDPRLTWVTVTGVDVAPDLKTAKVFYVVTNSEKNIRPASEGLTKAAPVFQHELGRNLKLKFTPRLTFILDESFESGARIDSLLSEVKEDKTLTSTTDPAKQLASMIAQAKNILLATHRNPDGDAIGSLLGFTRILKLTGKTPVTYCPDGIPQVLSFLKGADEITTRLTTEQEFDLTILLDTGGRDLLPEGFPEPGQRGTFVIIDHHQQHDSDFGDLVIRREAAAVGEIIFDMIRKLVWPLDKDIAECLYTSIVADTGSFRYSSTTANTLFAAAALVEAGARPWIVATALFESQPLRRQKLLALVLATLEICADARFAHMYSTPQMLAQVGAKKEDLDSMINFGRSIDTVKISAMFRVEASGDIKVSFRSKGSHDVGSIAARLGGGGHRNASGCTLHDTTLEEARAKITATVEQHFTGSTTDAETAD